MSDRILSLEELGIEILDDKSKSDKDLYGLFEEAAKGKLSIRFLRVVTPYKFRIGIINCMVELINTNIPEVEFLLANPFGEALLRKLDKEGKTNWQIWRIKNQILEFAKGILCISKNLTGCKVSIGFHSNDLIWNIGILDDNKVILRSYGKGEKIGHGNSVKELLLTSGKSSFLAESFINYYESVKSQPNTIWISSEKELEKFKRNNSWPSLFKGNAVRSSKKDLDKGENGPINEIAKICVNKKASVSECNIMKNTHDGTFFRLPGMSASITRMYNWRGTALEMNKIDGPSIYEIFCLMNQKMDKYNFLNEKASILGLFLDHSLKALDEFRVISKITIPEFEVYPYSENLILALNEVRPYLGALSGINWDKLMDDSKELGKSLEGLSCVRFRDAHMKNRLFKENNNNLISYLGSETHENLLQRIYDIDFESAHYTVTKWDDIIHILLFENMGLISLNHHELESNKSLNTQYLNNIGLEIVKTIENWIGLINNEERMVFWETLLLRSLREFCRRLWYANVMPNTYIQRYKHERKDYYLYLAIIARSQIGGAKFIDIQRFLEFCRENEKIWWSKIKGHLNEGKACGNVVPEIPQNMLGKVLILGKHSKDDKCSKLKLIRHKLKVLGYDAYCVIEKPDDQGVTFIDKALKLAEDSKFIIIENSEPGGQIYEIAKIENTNYPTIILQKRDEGPSWLLDGIENRVSNFEKFEYDNRGLQEAIENGVKWAEEFIFKRFFYI